MKNEFQRIPLILNDLQKFTTKENAVLALTTLNEIISSDEKEIEFLLSLNGIFIIMSFLESDSKLSEISLKILANASKRSEKIRRKLLKNNIFLKLATKLKNESKQNFILYSSLMVVLVQGNREAQDQMRSSGCLTILIYILNCLLDEQENEPLPPRDTELIIYTMIASIKNPHHLQNQTEIGLVIPKILVYLEKQTFLLNNQLQPVKCFWLFLKSALDRNEVNQQIFFKSCGLSVLFKSVQSISEEGKLEEMSELLVKITGVLVKLKCNKEFLSQSVNYCPMIILSGLLKTYNCLVIQQTIMFFDSLIQEFPEVLQIMKNKEVLKQIKKAKITLNKSREAAEVCQNLWKRIKIIDETQMSQESLIYNQQWQFFLLKNNLSPRSVSPDFVLKNHFCVVHDADRINTQNYTQPLSNNLVGNRGLEYKDGTPNLSKIRLSPANLNFHRKKFEEKEKKLNKVIRRTFLGSLAKNITPLNFPVVLGKKIILVFQKLLSICVRGQATDFRERLIK